jgi:hypothetical protein
MAVCYDCIFWTETYGGYCHHFSSTVADEKNIENILRDRGAKICDHFIPRSELKRLDAGFITKEKVQLLEDADKNFLKQAYEEFKICARPTHNLWVIRNNLFRCL